MINTLLVLVVIVYALTVRKSSPDMVLLGGLSLLVISRVVDASTAFAGFGNEGLITVAVLFVVADGLNQTGAIGFVGQRLLGPPSKPRWTQLRVTVPTGVLSAFLNNTPVVAMLVPVISDWSRKSKIPVSSLLMPLSFAAILGGMCTLVGTSTTLVINGLLIASKESDVGGLGMFEIGRIGLPAAGVGLLYMLVASRWLLPQRQPVRTQLADSREYTVEMLVEPNSTLVGQSIENAGLRHLPDVYLMEIDRSGQILPAVSPETTLQANDQLIFAGVISSVVDLRRIPGLTPATNQVFKLDSPQRKRCLIEAVVSNSCPYLKMTIREARFRTRYNAAVIAVARNGRRIDRKIGDIELNAGDVLLLESSPTFLDQHRNSRDFFLVSQISDYQPPRFDRAWIARLVLIGMTLCVAFNILTMLQAAMLAAGIMIMTECTTSTDAMRSVDWRVLLVIGAGLGLGQAVEQSGTAEIIATTMISSVQSNPHATLAVIYGITMVFTNLITAKAAATLFFPIGIEAAHLLGVDIMPFAIAIIMASAASFATPVGYQTNLMVAGPGGYSQSDYLRFGGPLSVLIWILCIVLIPALWPF